jgi:hypothetical protein
MSVKKKEVYVLDSVSTGGPNGVRSGNDADRDGRNLHIVPDTAPKVNDRARLLMEFHDRKRAITRELNFVNSMIEVFESAS